MSNRSDNPQKTLLLFILMMVLLTIVSGCGEDRRTHPVELHEQKHTQGKLAGGSRYSKTCIEGVTYIVGSHSSITVQLDRKGKIVPCAVQVN